MIQFLATLVEWVAGFSMMFLGLSYSTPDACETAATMIPIEYVSVSQFVSPSDIACASFEVEQDAEVKVFRI